MSSLAHNLHSPSRVPHLVLVPSYQSAGQASAAVYWRRRLVALVALISLAAAAWLLAGATVRWLSPDVSPPAATTSVSTPDQTWTVRPGDTLWSIARSVKPEGDIRSVLEPLINKYQGQPLRVGQVIVLP